MPDLARLRAHAISHSLFPPTTLKAALDRLGFVQADPIRSPARAQDLILRHRVKTYRAGDLERRYASLNIEEDFLYAYGFLPRGIWRLLHPRKVPGMSKLEKNVLAAVCKFGIMHPQELEEHFGSVRVINAWGGYSKATTRALELLHHRGLLRIARRKNGIRLYELTQPGGEGLSPQERLQKLVMATANVLAPVSEKSLQTNTTLLRSLGNTRSIIHDLLRTGELERQTVDGINYVWPHSSRVKKEPPRSVRFLAPFDPVVWDRRRFEHLWGWPYRFEAYTPAAKRLRGYYAMPLLWGESVIGWANASVEEQFLKIDVGFAAGRPTDADFRQELEAEVQRLETFLNLKRRQNLRLQVDGQRSTTIFFSV
jgi:uncharacterized protein YcaQ